MCVDILNCGEVQEEVFRHFVDVDGWLDSTKTKTQNE